MKVLHVVGARPNFMKTAPIIEEMSHYRQFEQILIHTGQHYDSSMSDIFFKDLSLPEPTEFLNVGSGTHVEQTARVMLEFERRLLRYKPDLVIVVGDVNSTLACALVCSKVAVRVAHVEAGLRSFDRSMREEINRVITDHIAELLFTPSADANENLLKEGISPSRIHFVGNVMIDTLVRLLARIEAQETSAEFGLSVKRYVLVTLHRPSNVDQADILNEILSALQVIAEKIPVVFPVHPRTRERIQTFCVEPPAKIRLVDPLGYVAFLSLMKNAALVITDSGGVQEETTFLGVPCLTLRRNTERPVTLQIGTNQLVSSTKDSIVETAFLTLSAPNGRTSIPALWDGNAAKRIVATILAH